MNREEIFRNFPTIETDRLLLRQLNIEDDATVLFEELYSDPEVTKYDRNRVYEVGNGGYSSLPSIRSKMELWQKDFCQKRGIVWGLELKSSRKLIGTRFCEFFSMGNIAHLECKLSKKYWNKGLMTEASMAIVDFLEFNDVKQIITTISKTNIPALKLAKKLDYTQVSINDLYFTKEEGLAGSMSLLALLDIMRLSDDMIFVKPRINPLAFKLLLDNYTAMKRRDFKTCESLCLKALEFQPDFIHAINGLAWAKLENSDPLGAIIEFNKLLRIKSNKYSGLLGRAYAYSDLLQWDDATNDLVSYLKLQPMDSGTFVMLGNCLAQSSRFKESIAAYDEALKINPNDKEAHEYKQNVIQYL